MSQQINLFNPIFLKEKKHFSAVTMLQALGVVVVGVLLMYAYSLYQSRTLKQEAAKTVAQLAEAKQQQARLVTELSGRRKNQALEDEALRVQEEHAGLQQAMTRLQNEEFGGRKGYSPYMKALARQIAEGIWLTGFSVDGSGTAIGIQGRALQPEAIPAYIGRLKQESVLQGKSFATLEIQQPKEDDNKQASVPAEAKKDVTVPFVEFDLRAAGVEKPVAKPAPATAKPATPAQPVLPAAPTAAPAAPAAAPAPTPAASAGSAP